MKENIQWTMIRVPVSLREQIRKAAVGKEAAHKTIERKFI